MLCMCECVFHQVYLLSWPKSSFRFFCNVSQKKKKPKWTFWPTVIYIIKINKLGQQTFSWLPEVSYYLNVSQPSLHLSSQAITDLLFLYTLVCILYNFVAIKNRQSSLLLKDNFPDSETILASFVPSEYWKCQDNIFWLPEFLMINESLKLLRLLFSFIVFKFSFWLAIYI